MYGVMIVDDEPIIRRGLRNSVQWQKYGMVIVGEAVDGQQAIELFEELKPDIIIADICMPDIDGLKMSELVLSQNPETKIVILTGHDEFEYAQKACKLGIKDYILKPTDPDELIGILENVKRSIDIERSGKEKMEELKKELQKNMPIIRENYLIRLVTGTVDYEDDKEYEVIIGPHNNKKTYQVAVFDSDSVKSEMLNLAVKNICSQLIDEHHYGWSFYNPVGQITVLINEDEDKGLRLLNEIHQIINKKIDITFSIGIGKCYSSMRDAAKSYNEALEALEYRFILGENSKIYAGDVQADFHNLTLNGLINIEKQILSNTVKGKQEVVLPLLNDYFEILKKQSCLTPLWVKAKCYELMCNMYFVFNDLNIKDVSLSKGLDELYYSVNKTATIKDILNIVDGFARELLGKIIKHMNTQTRKLIELCKEYIRSNYKEELTVSLISEYLNITPNYLSRIFKKETGEGCVDFINQVRIDEAKKLLKKTLYLTYEIAEMVGFNDPNYFSQSFKKYTGMSPTEYRDCNIY